MKIPWLDPRAPAVVRKEGRRGRTGSGGGGTRGRVRCANRDRVNVHRCRRRMDAPRSGVVAARHPVTEARRRTEQVVRIGLPVVLRRALVGSGAGNAPLARGGEERLPAGKRMRLDPTGWRMPIPAGRVAPSASLRLLRQSRRGAAGVVGVFCDWRARAGRRRGEQAPFLNAARRANHGTGERPASTLRWMPLPPRVSVAGAGIGHLKAIPLFPRRRTRSSSDCKANCARSSRRPREGGAVVSSRPVPAG